MALWKVLSLYKLFLKAISRMALTYFLSSILLHDGLLTKWWVLDTFFITVCVVRLCNDIMSCSSSHRLILLLAAMKALVYHKMNQTWTEWLMVCHSRSSAICRVLMVCQSDDLCATAVQLTYWTFKWHVTCVVPRPTGIYWFYHGHVPLFTF